MNLLTNYENKLSIPKLESIQLFKQAFIINNDNTYHFQFVLLDKKKWKNE